MLLTLQEDEVLRVCETPEAAATEVEAFDADEVSQTIFDKTAWLSILGAPSIDPINLMLSPSSAHTTD
jgi:hypothetical protein